MQRLCCHHDAPRAHIGHKPGLVSAVCAEHKGNALATASTAHPGQQSYLRATCAEIPSATANGSLAAASPALWASVPVHLASGICKIRCIAGFTKLGQRFPQYVLCTARLMSSMPTRACTASVTYHRAVVVPVNETVFPTYFKAAALEADQLLLAQAVFLRSEIL